MQPMASTSQQKNAKYPCMTVPKLRGKNTAPVGKHEQYCQGKKVVHNQSMCETTPFLK